MRFRLELWSLRSKDHHEGLHAVYFRHEVAYSQHSPPSQTLIRHRFAPESSNGMHAYVILAFTEPTLGYGYATLKY